MSLLKFERKPTFRDFLLLIGALWGLGLVIRGAVIAIQVGIHGRPFAEEIRSHRDDFDPVFGLLSLALWGLIFWGRRRNERQEPAGADRSGLDS